MSYLRWWSVLGRDDERVEGDLIGYEEGGTKVSGSDDITEGCGRGDSLFQTSYGQATDSRHFSFRVHALASSSSLLIPLGIYSLVPLASPSAQLLRLG
jgi:hypothetical protein